MRAQLHNSCAAAIANILSVAFVFNEDLACKLGIKDFLNTESAIENDRVAYVELLLLIGLISIR